MDQKFNQPTRHSKKAYDEAIAQNKHIRGKRETYLVAYAKYRLEYYQTLINPKTKEVD
jgi:hypothetical protein